MSVWAWHIGFHCAVLCRGLELYRTLLTKGGRIVFEVAVDYSHISHSWTDMIRLWVHLCLLISLTAVALAFGHAIIKLMLPLMPCICLI